MLKFISISLIIIVSISPVIGTYQILHDMVPGADDDMWNRAEWINNNTEKNTVIIYRMELWSSFYSNCRSSSVT